MSKYKETTCALSRSSSEVRPDGEQSGSRLPPEAFHSTRHGEDACTDEALHEGRQHDSRWRILAGTEGEASSWHLSLILSKSFILKKKNTKQY